MTRKELQKSSNLFLIGAICAVVVAALLTPLVRGSLLILPVLALQVGGLVLWVIGCIKYAESKGYPKAVGILGILTICGLVILVLLPNKWVEKAPVESPTNYPRPPQA